MSSCDSISPIDTVVDDARLRVERCRTELQDLLAQARERYGKTIAELELLSPRLSDERGESLLQRLEALRQSQLLHRTASELDGGIARLGEATASLEQAGAALRGQIGRHSPTQPLSAAPIEAVAIHAQEEERYRLAREIHDGPAQILANVALQLEYISKLATRDPARVKDELGTIQKDLRLAVGEVRRFMYDLRPPALAQQGMAAVVESHCQRLSERFGIKITVGWQSTTSLPAAHDVSLFRIVQEALQNVVKHARATQVDVRAQERDGILEVSVADNGKGFHPELVHKLDPKHFGLAGMRARAQQIGASLEVTSTPDRGTTIRLHVPLG